MSTEVDKFEISLERNCSVSIVKGNILDMDGLSVIHSSRSFDTDLSIVRKGSVLSQFLSRARQANVDIDSQIEVRTKQLASRGVYQDRLPFRKIVFNSGELCPLKVEDKVICLAGFCQTSDPFLSEELSLKEYFDYWEGLWRNLSLISVQKEIVNVTVPGGNFINVSGAPLFIDQKIGIALLTYFRFIQKNRPIRQLNICIDIGEHIVSDTWHKAIIPYIYGLSNLPIEITPVPITHYKPPIAKVDFDPIASLIEDLKVFFWNLSSHNGQNVTQFEGSKRINILINVDSGTLCTIVDSIKSHQGLSAYFGKPKGKDYDVNSFYEILGVLIESTNLFGNLNRRCVMNLGINEANDHLKQIIGDNLDNAINYIGQRLKRFKTQRESLYQQFLSLIPEDLSR